MRKDVNKDHMVPCAHGVMFGGHVIVLIRALEGPVSPVMLTHSGQVKSSQWIFIFHIGMG